MKGLSINIDHSQNQHRRKISVSIWNMSIHPDQSVTAHFQENPSQQHVDGSSRLTVGIWEPSSGKMAVPQAIRNPA